MRYVKWMVIGLLLGISSEAFGLVIESPKEGQTIVIGEPFQWIVALGPGEKCAKVGEGAPFNKKTGRYEWTDVLSKSRTLGKRKFSIEGELVGVEDDDPDCEDAEVTLNVVLPPTTVVVGIDAVIDNNQKDTILKIYRTATGELVQDDIRSTDQIGVGGMYSDGVERGIVDNPQITYTSTNEKVATVTPPSEETGVYPLVKAVGRGTANIIVRYGSFENILTVKVLECPYETRDEVPSKRGECKR